MLTTVYIDGFNLYYGSLKNRFPEYKWLDLKKFSEALLPTAKISKVRYFTARVNPPTWDLTVRSRQDAYLAALDSIPEIVVHDEGWFVQNPGLRPQLPYAFVRKSNKNPPQMVQVELAQEKGSDVNLASYLLLDCFNNAFEQAVIISNDSDLKTPIEIVRNQFKKSVGVINPGSKKKRSVVLASVASWTYQSINRKYFALNLLPTKITVGSQTIVKPSPWP